MAMYTVFPSHIIGQTMRASIFAMLLFSAFGTVALACHNSLICRETCIDWSDSYGGVSAAGYSHLNSDPNTGTISTFSETTTSVNVPQIDTDNAAWESCDKVSWYEDGSQSNTVFNASDSGFVFGYQGPNQIGCNPVNQNHVYESFGVHYVHYDSSTTHDAPTDCIT